MFRLVRQPTRTITCFVIACAFASFEGCSADERVLNASGTEASPLAVSADLAPALITVRGAPFESVSEGLGWNAENYWPFENHVDGNVPWNDAEWAAYNNLVAFLRPQFVRYGTIVSQWAPYYPYVNYSSNWMKNAYRQLDAFKAMGANVAWANWQVGSHNPDNSWWSEPMRNGTPPEVECTALLPPERSPYDDHPHASPQWTDVLADSVAHLRNVRGYSNVKYVSLWNEPDSHYSSPNRQYPKDAADPNAVNSFWPMYGELSGGLARRNARAPVGILGPETTWIEQFGNNIPTYVSDPQPGMQRFGQVVDQIAVHDYDDWFDYDPRAFDYGSDPDARVYQSASAILSTLDSIRGRTSAVYNAKGRPSPPFFLTEIGNTGFRHHYKVDDTAVADGALFAAELSVRALAKGYDGIARWNLTSLLGVNEVFNSALIPFLYQPSTSKFEVVGPSYYSGAVLSRYLVRESIVYGHTVSGAGSPQRIFVAPIRRPDGHWTFYLVNDDFVGRQVDLDLTALGLADGTTLYEFGWSAEKGDAIHSKQALKYKGRRLNLRLDARSVLTLTTAGASDFTPNAALTVDPANGRLITTPLPTLVKNGGFEGGTVSGWQSSGLVTVETNATWSNSGNRFVTLNTSFGASEIYQTVTGLTPGNYLLLAHARTSGANVGKLGVRAFDGTRDDAQTFNSAGYRTITLPFTVPAGGSSATLYMSGAAGAGTWINGDDFELVKVEGLTNGGFEFAAPSSWTATGTAAREATTAAHSGSAVATIHTSFGAGRFSQRVTGLSPGKYGLSAYVRAGAGAVGTIRVEGFGSTDVAASTSNDYYKRLKVEFTLPPGRSAVTVSYEAPQGGPGSYTNADDFELRLVPNHSIDVIADDLWDFSKTHRHSPGLYFDDSNKATVGDCKRAARTNRSAEWLVYKVPAGLKRFLAWGWYWPNEQMQSFTFFTSPDDVTYTPFTPQIANTMSEFTWNKQVYDGRQLPAGTKYLKVVFPTFSAYGWNPQLGHVYLYP